MLALLLSGQLVAFDEAHISSASGASPSGVSKEVRSGPSANAGSPGTKSTDSSSEAPPSAARTGWSLSNFLKDNSIWSGPPELVRPESGNSSAPMLDYKAQKEIWERMDRRRHWMLVDPDPGTAFRNPSKEFDPTAFEPSASKPRSMLQKKAMEDVLRPSTPTDRPATVLDSPEASFSTPMVLDSPNSRGDGSQPDSWSMRNALRDRGVFDWEKNSGRGSDSGNGSWPMLSGVNTPSDAARLARERGQRLDEMFGGSSSAAAWQQNDRDARGLATGTEPMLSRRERLEQLFNVSDPVAAAASRNPANPVNPTSLGRGQRNDLFGDESNRGSAVGRRPKATDDVVKRPAFKPQPGELPLPRPNGL